MSQEEAEAHIEHSKEDQHEPEDKSLDIRDSGDENGDERRSRSSRDRDDQDESLDYDRNSDYRRNKSPQINKDSARGDNSAKVPDTTCCSNCRRDARRGKKACICMVPVKERKNSLEKEGCVTCGCFSCHPTDKLSNYEELNKNSSPPKYPKSSYRSSRPRKEFDRDEPLRNGCCKQCMRAFAGKACICQVPSHVRNLPLGREGCYICACQGCHPMDVSSRDRDREKDRDRDIDRDRERYRDRDRDRDRYRDKDRDRRYPPPVPFRPYPDVRGPLPPFYPAAAFPFGDIGFRRPPVDPFGHSSYLPIDHLEMDRYRPRGEYREKDRSRSPPRNRDRNRSRSPGPRDEKRPRDDNYNDSYRKRERR